MKQLPKQLLARSQRLLLNRSVVLLLLLTAGFTIAHLSFAAKNSEQATRIYQNQLRSQVETSEGAPREGRDPAVQQQDSLSIAASLPSGNGQRVDNPASDVPAEKQDHTNHSSHTSPKPITSGCLADYGVAGEQCLPKYIADTKPVNCAAVKKMFAQGIKVNGTDSLGLDSDRNMVACDAGDL